MSLTLEDVAKDRREVKTTYAGQEFSITFTPSALTLEMTKMSDRTNADALVETLASLLVDWDFYTDETKTTKVPTTYESLCKISLPFLAFVMSAITQADNVGETPGGTFGAG